ncbi:MAG: rhodanese-like domain-containing protein [Caldilineaceae bacterium]
MKGYKELLAEANRVIKTISIAKAVAQIDNPDVIFVDLRGEMELAHTGIIPGAIHVRRGMLELVIDPDSPYHNSIFSMNKQFVFYCASGIRSAMAVQRAMEMGLPNVVQLAGGLKAWKEAGYTLDPYQSTKVI